MKLLIVFNEDIPYAKDDYDKIIYYSPTADEFNKVEANWRKYLNEFSAKNLGDKNILEYLKIDNYLNIWFYHKFRIFHSYRDAYHELQFTLDKSKVYKEITIVTNNLPRSSWGFKIINSRPKKKKSTYISTLVKFILISLYRSIIGRFKIKKVKGHILLGTPHSEIETVSILDINNKYKSNSVWGYLEEKYKESFTFIEDSVFPKLGEHMPLNKRLLYLKNKKSTTNEYILFKSLFKKNINKEIKSANRLIKKNNMIMINHVKHDSFDKIMINHLINSSKINSLYIRKYYSYKEFFKKNKSIKSITTFAENSPNSKIILDAAKSHKIKTYGIQHGIIGEYNMAYNYSKEEAKLLPFPDKTFVWGSYWENQLKSFGNYPQNKLLIVGHPRTDIVKYYKETFKPSGKLITFFTQPNPDKEERILAFDSIMYCAAKFENLSFVVKLHPAEKDDIYSSRIKSEGLKNIYLENKENTYKLLAMSSVSITCYSTVGLESLYFDNKLIVFDSKEKDIAHYIKNDIAYCAKNKLDLYEYLKSFNKKKLSKKNNVKDYLRDMVYKIDGKVNERIKNNILI